MRLLVVDDHRLFAEALRGTLQAEAGITVVAVACTAADAVRLASRHRPDLVLLDISLPDASGLSAGREILEDRPATRVVAMTALNDRRAVSEAIRIGFHGYLTKDVPVRRLVASLRSVMRGAIALPNTLLPPAPEPRELEPLLERLTPREREVLSLMVEGAGGGEIARRLGVSAHTVRTHVQNLLRKLHVHSRLEAVALAVRASLDGDEARRA